MSITYRLTTDFLTLKKGLIINATGFETEIVLKDDRGNIMAKLPVNSPLLEKIEKKHFTILSVKNTINSNGVWKLDEKQNIFFYNTNSFVNQNFTYAEMLTMLANSTTIAITSVRRESDGAVFALNDKITGAGLQVYTIEKFRIEASERIFWQSKEYMFIQWVSLETGNVFKPKVIGTTDEDKVYFEGQSQNILQGEDFWCVDVTANTFKKYNTNTLPKGSQLEGAYFKSEKAAQDYIDIVKLAVSLNLKSFSVLKDVEGKKYRISTWVKSRAFSKLEANMNSKMKVFGFKYLDGVPCIIADSVNFAELTKDYYIIPLEQFNTPKVTIGKKTAKLVLTEDYNDVRVFVCGDYVSTYQALLKLDAALETIKTFTFGSRPLTVIFSGKDRNSSNIEAFIIGAYTVSRKEVQNIIKESKKIIDKAHVG
jgi:hypothetical protein